MPADANGIVTDNEKKKPEVMLMIELVIDMPKEELLNRIDKLTNKYEIDPAFGFNPKPRPELVGKVMDDVFWFHKVVTGTAWSITAFYGVACENGEKTKIKGEFKIIPEVKIWMVFISVLHMLIILQLSCAGGFSVDVFLKLIFGYILITFFITGILCLMSRSDIKPLMEIINALDDYEMLEKLIKSH